MILLSQIKEYVSAKARIGNPYGRYFTASVTIAGDDIYREGETRDEALVNLSRWIFYSKYLSSNLEKSESFKLLNP